MSGDDAGLVRRCLGGDEKAYRELVERYQAPVYSIALRMVRRSEDAEDLTQETFSRAMRGLDHYAGRAPVRSWLLSVARHTVADRYRSREREPRTEPAEDRERALGPGAAEPGRFDEYLALVSLLAELPEERRTAFVLTQVQRVPYAEAARIIGVPIGTVRSRVARSRRDLARLLREAA